jgi:three-Cys-motif partner protein
MTGDSQPPPEVGRWSEDKHERIRAYLKLAAKPAAKSFLGRGKAGFCYIDPFCGPGRATIRETGLEIDGSALVAAQAARSAGAPFSCIYIADLLAEHVDACAARLRGRGETVCTYVGPALETSAAITRDLPTRGLHFSFLDPYDLQALPFDVIKRLSAFKHMDILVHFSAMDVQRNVDRYLTMPISPLDAFAPRWRERVQVRMPKRDQRRHVREHWQSLLAQLGMPTAQSIEHIQGSKNQSLYWLLFAARHPLAHKLWDAIVKASKPQRGFDNF